MTNAWAIIAANQVGAQPIDEASTTQRHTLGLIVQAKSSTYGVGEFIYLKGVASTVVGSVVNYDALFQTALNTTGLSTPRPLAVSMSVCDASTKFGWYQISGVSRVVKSNALSLAVGSCIATSGGAAIVVASGLIVNGAIVAAAASAVASSTAVSVMINRPTDPSDVS